MYNNHTEMCYLHVCAVLHVVQVRLKSGPGVIIILSCSTQLSLKFILLANVKMPISIGILTFMSRMND